MRESRRRHVQVWHEAQVRLFMWADMACHDEHPYLPSLYHCYGVMVSRLMARAASCNMYVYGTVVIMPYFMVGDCSNGHLARIFAMDHVLCSITSHEVAAIFTWRTRDVNIAAIRQPAERGSDPMESPTTLNEFISEIIHLPARHVICVSSCFFLFLFVPCPYISLLYCVPFPT